MSMNTGKKLVIALGGNALGQTAKEQLNAVKKTAKTIVDLVESGYTVVVGHGNGPQVGIINLAMETSAASEAKTPQMPFPECGAMSQGYIGYHLQQAIRNELVKRKMKREVVALITQSVVNPNDSAFSEPTKPVGMFYSKEEAEKISKETGYHFVEDSGRGYRRVVASPKPCRIVEFEAIKHLVDNNDIVITVGGGGIPVIEKDGELIGVDAVIDKDMSSAKLAVDIKADGLLILTAVNEVYLNYNTPKETRISKISDKQALKYSSEGQFAKGSMLPKIEACLNYLEEIPNGKAIITSLNKAEEAVRGEAGTVIYKNVGDNGE